MTSRQRTWCIFLVSFAVGVVLAMMTGAPARGADHEVLFHAGTVNVRKDMTVPKIRADIFHAASRGGLIGWNEIHAPGREALRELSPNGGALLGGRSVGSMSTYMPRDGSYWLEDPISWPSDLWSPEAHGFVKVQEFHAQTGPARYASWVILRRIGTETTVARVNTHLVAHAWCKHRVPFKAWRREAWTRSVAKIRALVTRLNDRADAVIVSGDFNRDSFKILGDGASYDNGLESGTFGSAHYDYVMHPPLTPLPPGHIRVRRFETLHGFNTDHRPVFVWYGLSR